MRLEKAAGILSLESAEAVLTMEELECFRHLAFLSEIKPGKRQDLGQQG